MTKIQYDYELIAATSREKEKRLLVVGVDLCDERNDLPKQHRCHTLIAPMKDNAVVDSGWKLAMCDNEENGVETVSGDSVIAATRGSKQHVLGKKNELYSSGRFTVQLIPSHLSIHDAIMSAISLVPMILPPTKLICNYPWKSPIPLPLCCYTRVFPCVCTP